MQVISEAFCVLQVLFTETADDFVIMFLLDVIQVVKMAMEGTIVALMTNKFDGHCRWLS